MTATTTTAATDLTTVDAPPSECNEAATHPDAANTKLCEMIARAQAGDHAAFDWLYRRFEAGIFNFIYRTMGSRDDAYELSQETWLKAYVGLPRTSDDLHFQPWVYRIAMNVCLDVLRHRKLVKWQPWEAWFQHATGNSATLHARELLVDRAPQPDEAALRHELTEAVQAIFAQMYPKYRLVLHLKEYNDLSYDEIAEVFSTTRAAIKSLLFRARAEFRQLYAKAERKPELMR